MSLTFTPLHPVFAAECSGVDIGEPITRETAAAIEDAMDRYAVLVFRRGTPLTTAAAARVHPRASASWNRRTGRSMPRQGVRLDNPALSDISNLAPGDKILPRDDRKRLFNVIGNQLWHSDSSYKAIPARYSAAMRPRHSARQAARPSSPTCAPRGTRSSPGSRQR